MIFCSVQAQGEWEESKNASRYSYLMLNWRDMLGVSIRESVESLTDYGCRWCWRADGNSQALQAPNEDGNYFLELWKRGRLLDFVSVSCPFDDVSRAEIATLITRQQYIHRQYDGTVRTQKASAF